MRAPRFSNDRPVLPEGAIAEYQPIDSTGRILVEPLSKPTVARQLAAGAASASVALTTTCSCVSIFARGANIRYVVASSSPTASATSHYIAQGERLNINVPATPWIAAIQADATAGTLEISEQF